LDISSIVEARRILTKLVLLVISQSHPVTSQGCEIQIAPYSNTRPLFAALYAVYNLGDVLADMRSSTLYNQACANVVLHLKPEVRGEKEGCLKTLLVTEEAKVFVNALLSYKQTHFGLPVPPTS
jgi:hypothetical protein